MLRFATKFSIAPTILAIVFLVKFLFPLFEDPDFYWHLKTGEALLAGDRPYIDVFTHTNLGHDRVLTGWLAQIVFFVVFELGGYFGVGLLVALLYTLCWCFAYAMSRKILGDEAKAVIATLIFCGLFGAVAPRPHLFTFLLFAVLLYVLLDFKYFGRDRHLWLIPVIMLLWSNLHGGFFIGLVLLAVFLGSEWSMRLYAGNADPNAGKRLARLTGFAAAGLCATAVNPHFFGLWLYPFRAIMASGDMAIINEWQSPNFHYLFFQYFLATVLAFFVCMAYSRRKPDLTELSVPLLFVTGAFVSVRNLPLAALAMAPFFAVFYKHLARPGVPPTDQRKPPSALSARIASIIAMSSRQVSTGNEHMLNLLVLVVSLLAVAAIYPVHQRKLQASIEELLPVKATDFVLANGITGKVFNTYHYGGYLLFRLYPAQRVFVYGRTDILPKGFLENYNAIYRGEPNWKAEFAKYDVDYVMVESKAPLRQLLLAGDSFKLVFDDAQHSVLVKDTEQFRALVAQQAVPPRPVPK